VAWFSVAEAPPGLCRPDQARCSTMSRQVAGARPTPIPMSRSNAVRRRRRRFQRTSEPVAQRSFDPGDRMKAEKARRAELVGIALDVLLAKAVEHALCPSLEV